MRAPASELPIVFAQVSLLAGSRSILEDVTLTLLPGAPTALVGPNGAGKTTLIRLAMSLVRPDAGTITWGGRSAGAPERRAMVFQRPTMLRRSVRGNVAFALGGAALAHAERQTRIAEVLARTGLTEFAGRPARRLSGGEQQRVALARALVREPEVLFLDEPTAHLDPAATKAVEAIIRDAAARGIKVVLATHDLPQARRLCGEVIFLCAGRLIEQTETQRFFSNPESEQAAAFLRGDIVV